MIGTVQASRYVTPLREGGSLPGIVEADDLGTYVVKFRGAGQGVKALVAEVVVGELARRLGLRVPELRALELDPVIARYEADQEVQDLLNASVGLNLAVDFLPGSFGWDAGYPVDPDEAARILWLDAFTANVDRSWRNPEPADLAPPAVADRPRRGAVLPPRLVPARRRSATLRPAALRRLRARAGRPTSPGWPRPTGRWRRWSARELLAQVLDQVPDEWLEPDGGQPAAVRRRYLDYLLARLAGEPHWLPRAVAA